MYVTTLVLTLVKALSLMIRLRRLQSLNNKNPSESEVFCLAGDFSNKTKKATTCYTALREVVTFEANTCL